jgi:hypothetical protein
MATTVGQLTIEMAANIVRLQHDMDNAKKTVSSAMTSIERAADKAANTLSLIGVSLSGAAIGMFIKNAIDAADKLDDLSKKTGLSAESLSSLAFAFKMSNVEVESMQKALTKLSKNAIDNEDAFTALGISVKKADGTYKAADVIFKEVATFFAKMPDGVLKTKLSLELFDKAGADLIPILNGGALGIEEMTKRAEELGLVISTDATKASEEFKDQLDTLNQQMIATTVNGLTPFIKSASNLIESLMKLPKLLEDNKTALMLWSAIILAPAIVVGIPALVAGLGALALGVIAIGAAFAANPVALILLTLTAAAIPAIKAINDYVVANKEADKANAALNQSTAETARLLQLNKTVAEGNNKATDESTLKMAEAAIKAKERAAEEKKLNEELLKQAEAYRKLISSIDEKIALNKAELSSTDKLTESQKLEIKYRNEINSGILKLTKTQQDALFVKIAEMRETEKSLDLQKEAIALAKLEKEILEESAKSNYAVYEAITKKNKSIQDEVDKQKEANSLILLGADAVEKLVILKLRDHATTADQNAELAELAYLSDGVVNGYKDQAKALRDLADAKEKGIGLKAAKEAQEAWDKAASSITEGLTDALMRGFESGKGFVDNILSFIKNKFKSTVAEFIIRPIMSPMGNMFASMMPTAAGVASGGGGMFGSILGGASQMGTLFGTGASATMGGAGFMDMMGASSAMMGNGSMMGGLAMGAGAVMPYVLAAAALVSLVKSLDDSGTLHAGGTATASATGATATTGSELNFVVETNKQMQSSIVTMAGSISSTLNGLQRAFGKAEEVVVGLGFADDSSSDGAWGALKILASGKTLVDWASGVDRWPGFEFSDGESGLAEFTAKIATDVKGMISELGLPDWALAITNNLQEGATLEEVLNALNQVAMIKTQLVEAGNALTLMGGPLAGLALAGDSAVLAVSELVGGIDQLVIKAQGFMSNYYTENEQAGVLAASLTQSLERAGFSQAQIAALQTRADFRALLESIDINTNQGAEQFAALLTVQQQFADLQGYLEAQGITLQELAKSAPQVAILTAIQATAVDSAATALEVATASATSLTSIDTGVSTMTGAIASLDSTMSTGLSAIAGATTSAISIADQAIASANASAAIAVAAARAGSGIKDSTLGISAYASGGSYGGGMALVGEKGPELIDFNNGGQVYSASQTANMIGGEVAVEIRALREEVSLLRYEARSTAINTSKIAKLQDNWDVRGLTVKTDIDQPLDTVAV